MCLSIPALVKSIDGNIAIVSLEGNLVKADISLLDAITPGEYILLHSGFAIQKLDEAAALESLRVIRELADELKEQSEK